MRKSWSVMNIKGAIFDLDGTLLDSMPYWENLGYEYLIRECYSPREDLNEALKTMSLAQSARYFREFYSVPKSEQEIINDIIRLIEEQYRCEVPLKASAKDVLKKLHKSGVRMCIATATGHDLAKAALKRLDAEKYFEFILTPLEAGTGKDDPAFFEKALNMLDTPRHETIVVEDALHAIISAKKAGLFVAAIYDKSAHYEKEEIKRTADIYFNSFEDWKVVL